MDIEKHLKYLPLITIIMGLIATFAVLQYKIEVVSGNVKDIQTTLSDVVVQSAVTNERISNIKEQIKQ